MAQGDYSARNVAASPQESRIAAMGDTASRALELVERLETMADRLVGDRPPQGASPAAVRPGMVGDLDTKLDAIEARLAETVKRLAAL
jgi:hypothetical protein